MSKTVISTSTSSWAGRPAFLDRLGTAGITAVGLLYTAPAYASGSSMLGIAHGQRLARGDESLADGLVGPEHVGILTQVRVVAARGPRLRV